MRVTCKSCADWRQWQRRWDLWYSRYPWLLSTGVAALVSVGELLATQALLPYTGRLTFGLVVPAVALAAQLCDAWSGGLTMAFTFLWTWYFLLPPVNTFRVNDKGELLRMGIQYVIAVLFIVLLNYLNRAGRRSAWLAAILDSSENAVFSQTMDGTINNWNSRAEQIYGYTAAEVLGQAMNLLVPDERRDEMRDLIERAQQGERIIHHEMVHRSKSGHLVPIAINVVGMHNRAGNLFGVSYIVHDITEEKNIIQSLRQQQDQLSLALAAANAGSFELDVSTSRGSWSAENFNIFGANPAEVHGRFEDWYERLLPEDRKRLATDLERALKNGELNSEFRIRRTNDGVVRWIVSRGKVHYNEQDLPERVVGINMDITDRKRVEEALRESELRVRRKLDNLLAPEGDLGQLELRDIIDLPGLQSMMVDFRALSGVPVAMLDLTGQVLFATGWQEICAKFHRRNRETCRKCAESDQAMGAADVPAGQYKLFYCKNHMWDAVTPVYVGGKHLANIVSGQFFVEDEGPDVEQFRAQAQQYGFPEDDYLAALQQVPRLSREKLGRAMAFIIKFASLISELSYSNLKLVRAVGDRDRLTEVLRENEKHLREQAEKLERLAAEAESQRARLDFALESAGLAEWELDPATGIVSRSLRHDQLFGYNALQPEWTANHLLDCVLPEARATVEAVIRQIQARVAIGEVEVPISWPDGSQHWIAILGRAPHVVVGDHHTVAGILMDITQRKQAELALQEREQQMRIILDLLPVGVFIADASGRIMRANPAARTIWDLGDTNWDESRKLPCRRLGSKDYCRVGEDALSLAAHNGTVALNEEIEIEDRAGRLKTILRSALPILDAQGRLSGAVAVDFDISERKHAERALIRSEKLASVGRMATTLAHEVNNPLAAAINAVYLAARGTDVLPETRQILLSAEHELNRIAHLTRQTLAFYREPTSPAMFRLHETVDNIMLLLAAKFEVLHLLLLRRYVADDQILGVEGEARQIISNLLSNAIEASQSGGRILVRTAKLRSLHDAWPVVRLTIADCGVGIDAAQREKVFEPFFTTKTNVGTGLGLWITKELATRQNARIRMRSVPGRGTVVSLYFKGR